MVSVIIPALKEEKFLPDCLRSLANQGCKDGCEIIVVDNGSIEQLQSEGYRFVTVSELLDKPAHNEVLP